MTSFTVLSLCGRRAAQYSEHTFLSTHVRWMAISMPTSVSSHLSDIFFLLSLLFFKM